jgi:NAD-dependent dihydropyrimidine dehydrogenase PreA subunit
MMRLSDMNTLQFDTELCNGCGMCINVCPHVVFTLNSHKVIPVGADDCMECGACQVNCPTGAIIVDSGVGCAAAMFWAAITGKKEVSCG